MTASNCQEINERIKVPKPILDRRGRQHQHIAKPSFFERFPETHSDLRRRIDAVEVAKLVRLIQHQHLKPIFGNLVEM